VTELAWARASGSSGPTST